MLKRTVLIISLLVASLAGLHAQTTNDSLFVTKVENDKPVFVVADTSGVYFSDARPAKVRQPSVSSEVWLPDPQKSLWLAFVFPGLGQIYNRSYWKLPIVYGGAMGLAYGIAWNNRYYQEYSQAYRDAQSSNALDRTYDNLLPAGTDPTSDYAINLLKSQHNTYRRYRDLCIVGAVAFYALTIIEAYVDAQLSDFDISPDLSMRVHPTVFMTENSQQPNFGVGVGVNF
jgi:hypothetical protein